MPTETLYPDAILVQTNLTGAVSTIDSAEDGTWMTSAGSGSTLRVSFPTPTANPTTGAGLQTFRVYVRKDAAGGGDPTIDEIDLYENGTLVTTLLSGVLVTSATGQAVTVTWDAAALGIADGSTVEAHVVASKGGGGPNERNVEFDSVSWVAEVQGPQTIDAAGTDISTSTESGTAEGGVAITTITAQVAAGADDAEEYITGSTNLPDSYPTGWTGNTSSDLEIIYTAEDGTQQYIGIRFPSLAVPQGATIHEAYITFEPDTDPGTSGATTTPVAIHGEDIDDAPQFPHDASGTASFNISSRTHTTASVTWNISGQWVDGVPEDTPDLSAIVQEIVGRAGWVSGNALAMLLHPGETETTEIHRAESYNGNASLAPILTVSYSEPPTAVDATGSDASASSEAGTAEAVQGGTGADASASTQVGTPTAVRDGTGADASGSTQVGSAERTSIAAGSDASASTEVGTAEGITPSTTYDGTGADASGSAEVGAAQVVAQGAGADASASTQVGTVEAQALPVTADASSSTEVGAAQQVQAGAGSDASTSTQVGAASVEGTVDATGADASASTQAGQAQVQADPLGVDASTGSEQGTAQVVATGQGADASTSTQVGTASVVGQSVILATGTSVSTSTQAGAAGAVLTGAGVDEGASTQAGAGQAVLGGSGADASASDQVGGGTAVLTAGGQDASASDQVGVATLVSAVVILAAGTAVSTSRQVGSAQVAAVAAGSDVSVSSEQGAARVGVLVVATGRTVTAPGLLRDATARARDSPATVQAPSGTRTLRAPGDNRTEGT